MTMEELIEDAVDPEPTVLQKALEIEFTDPEYSYLKEEEAQARRFYEKLFPKEIVKQGVPDFSTFLNLINDEEWKPTDLL